MSQIITDNDAQYALDIVKTICTEVGPGLPGSSQERKRAAIIQKQLESHLDAENIRVEEFSFAPAACLASFPLCGLCILISALLNISTGRFVGFFPWVTTIATLALSILSVLLIVLEFFLSFEIIDPLFPKRQSVNVVGTVRRPGTENVKRLLILSGHHDSAPENTWLRFLGYGSIILMATGFIGPVTMLVMSSFQLIGIVTGNAHIVAIGTLGWVLLAYPIVPSIIFALFFTRGWKNGGNVPGAADNLSASALAVAMCGFLVKNPSYIPADTEIRFISFGSEEAGLRGSRRYVACHLDELKQLDARLLNIETAVYSEISILTSDVSGSVKNSPEMVRSVVSAAERAGVPYKLKSASPGVANDSGPFSRAGLKALTILPFKLPEQMVAFYHQKWDTPEILTIEPLLNVLKLTFEWIRCGGE